jgi:hypothetical protein
MKTKKNLLLLISLSLFLYTCKKDYPSDIPQWLKDKIEHCKKTHDCCGYNSALTIMEFKNDSGDIQYKFSLIETYTLYDYQGNVLCIYNLGISDCPNYIGAGYNESRIIWEEDPNKCP